MNVAGETAVEQHVFSLRRYTLSSNPPSHQISVSLVDFIALPSHLRTLSTIISPTHITGPNVGKERGAKQVRVKMDFKLRGLLPLPGNVSLGKRD